MDDLISRQEAIKAVGFYSLHSGDRLLFADKPLVELPSAHSDLISWLLDEIWDEDMWELNWQAFPELVCRKLEKLGYVKREGDEYEQLDKQTGGD